MTNLNIIGAGSGFRRAGRIAATELSEIVRISERAAALRQGGRDVIALSTGEPDFPTPPDVIEAAHRAALAGKTRYTATAGAPELRDALAERAGAARREVLVATGAKQVIANAMLASLDPGDEVVIPAPYWTTYSDVVAMSGGTPVVVPCGMEAGFKLSPEALEAAITPRTRWLMLNSPSNPTGAIYRADEYRRLAEVLARHPQVWVIADEIYEHLAFADFTSFVAAAPGLRERTLVVNGVSKAWSMTGWRIGWGVGPGDLIAAMTAVQGQVTSGACSVAQAAALAAITGDDAILRERRAVLQARRDRVVAALGEVEGVVCPVPEGAFYVFPSIQGLMAQGGFATDACACAWLLEEIGLAIVPGQSFGLPGHVRISFAYSDAEIGAGMARLAAAAVRLSRPGQGG